MDVLSSGCLEFAEGTRMRLDGGRLASSEELIERPINDLRRQFRSLGRVISDWDISPERREEAQGVMINLTAQLVENLARTRPVLLGKRATAKDALMNIVLDNIKRLAKAGAPTAGLEDLVAAALVDNDKQYADAPVEQAGNMLSPHTECAMLAHDAVMGARRSTRKHFPSGTILVGDKAYAPDWTSAGELRFVLHHRFTADEMRDAVPAMFDLRTNVGKAADIVAAARHEPELMAELVERLAFEQGEQRERASELEERASTLSYPASTMSSSIRSSRYDASIVNGGPESTVVSSTVSEGGEDSATKRNSGRASSASKVTESRSEIESRGGMTAGVPSPARTPPPSRFTHPTSRAPLVSRQVAVDTGTEEVINVPHPDDISSYHGGGNAEFEDQGARRGWRKYVDFERLREWVTPRTGDSSVVRFGYPWTRDGIGARFVKLAYSGLRRAFRSE